MFETSIHWTTFFYLLVDLFLILFVCIRSFIIKSYFVKRYLFLGLLFVFYNATGGFLPTDFFPGPFILQYIITYGVAIALCVFIIYYLYKEYDIEIIKNFSIRNISILLISGFIVLFLIPYFITKSLYLPRILFTLPFSIIGFYFLWLFHRELHDWKQMDKFILRRNILTILSISSVVILPILTLIGDYQWLTFTIMNISFYLITAIEIDRYLNFLENKYKFYKSSSQEVESEHQNIDPKLINYGLTQREIEISLAILDNKSYKKIAKDYYIAPSTASKHASNIFKKTGTKNKREFLNKFNNPKLNFIF